MQNLYVYYVYVCNVYCMHDKPKKMMYVLVQLYV